MKLYQIKLIRHQPQFTPTEVIWEKLKSWAKSTPLCLSKAGDTPYFSKHINSVRVFMKHHVVSELQVFKGSLDLNQDIIYFGLTAFLRKTGILGEIKDIVIDYAEAAETALGNVAPKSLGYYKKANFLIIHHTTKDTSISQSSFSLTTLERFINQPVSYVPINKAYSRGRGLKPLVANMMMYDGKFNQTFKELYFIQGLCFAYNPATFNLEAYTYPLPVRIASLLIPALEIKKNHKETALDKAAVLTSIEILNNTSIKIIFDDEPVMKFGNIL